MKKKIFLSLLCATTLFLTGCSESDITDQVANITQAEDENVLAVKGGEPSSYPGTTYGDAFDKFFGSPTWKYFEGTKEGPDDDGDGKPDYTEENVDIVEFTGYCTYQDVEVKALIQFTLDNENGTFEATYLAFNDVPQSNIIMWALLEKVFEGEPENDTADTDTTTDISDENETAQNEEESENTVQEDEQKEDTSKEEVQEAADNYKYLDEFITTINSYSDPPELDTDQEYDDYYKGLYREWLNKEAFTNIIVEDGHVCIDDHSAEYSGEWGDMTSQRCYMTISCTDGVYYYIDINWGSSAWDNTHWSFMGTYDSEQQGISYTGGSKYEEHYPEDGGDMQQTTDYTDGSGLIYISDGMLYWIDNKEDTGNGQIYEKSETSTQDSQYIIADSDSRYLAEADLVNYDKATLRLARNEIYARHGRIFNAEDLVSYFNSQSWYVGLYTEDQFDDSVLNDFERANLDTIKSVEDSK